MHTGTIQFDYRDWQNGFFVTFEVPYSQENFEAILALRNSANIKFLK